MHTEALEVSLLNSPQNWESRMELIGKALQNGQTDKAEALVKEAPALPEDEASRVYCARVLAQTNPGGARAILEEMVADGQPHPQARLELSRLLHAAGDSEGAHTHFNLAASGDPSLGESGFESAMAGETPDAIPAKPAKPVHAPGAVSDEADEKPVLVAALRPPTSAAPMALSVPHADSRAVKLPGNLSQPINLPPPSGPTGTVVVPPIPAPLPPEATAPEPDGHHAVPHSPFGNQAVGEEALRAMQRKTKAASFTIGVLLHAVLLVIFSLLVVIGIQKKPPEIVTYIGDPNAPRTMEKKVVQQNIRMQSSPTSAETRMITSTAPSAVFVPAIDKFVETEAVGLGGIGAGGLGGIGNVGSLHVPFGMRSRCTKSDRMKRIAESGGSVKCEAAVVGGLDWLAKAQNEDGSWTNENASHKVGVSGLCLLAFCGHCETMSSSKYGATVRKAIEYLLSEMDEANFDAPTPIKSCRSYGFAIAVYSLSEAYAMNKQNRSRHQTAFKKMESAIKKGARAIIRGQGPNGGWGYTYNGSTAWDTSTTGWQVQALKAVKTTGIKVSGLESAMSKSVSYFAASQGPKGSFSYGRAGEDKPTLAGVGVFCLQLLGEGKGKVAQKGIDYIQERYPKGKKVAYASINTYEWYYNMFATMMNGGSAWKQYNRMAMDLYLDNQDKDGHWPLTGGHVQGNDGVIYQTALCTLSMEVYYRYLPSIK